MADGTHYVLEGSTAVALMPLLDGTRSLPELMGELGAHAPAEVLGDLRRMQALGLLADGSVGSDLGATGFWDTLGVAPEPRPAALALVNLSAMDMTPAREAFVDAGFSLADDGSLLVALIDDYLDPRLRELNRRMFEAKRPWVLAKLSGATLWLGPYMRPGQTACWHCMAERLEGNRQLDRYLRTKNGRSPTVHPGTVGLRSATTAGAALLAIELQAILAGSRRLEDNLITIELTALASEHHPVVRQPTCAVCGDPQLRDAPRDSRVVLQPAPKRFTEDGGHRVMRPEETFARLQRHISPITGAVTSVRRQTIEDNGVAYSYSSGHNFALMQDSLYFLRKNLRGRSGGKGRTDHQAKVGAVCEAIERYNGIYRGDEPHVNGSYAELAERALHPEKLLLFSDEQYANRDAWNAAQRTSYHVVPARLDPERAIQWTPVWSLRDERERWHRPATAGTGTLTSARTSMRQRRQRLRGGQHARGGGPPGSDGARRAGLGGGWWYNRVPRPAVDLESFDEPYVELVREHYARLGRNLWVLDITTDLGIPAFVGCSQRLERADTRTC